MMFCNPICVQINTTYALTAYEYRTGHLNDFKYFGQEMVPVTPTCAVCFVVQFEGVPSSTMELNSRAPRRVALSRSPFSRSLPTFDRSTGSTPPSVVRERAVMQFIRLCLLADPRDPKKSNPRGKYSRGVPMEAISDRATSSMGVH